jgi:RNA polymerase sigma-70 factor, ECF subfamily
MSANPQALVNAVVGSGRRSLTRMLSPMELLDEDAQLMLRYQAGDERAFELLYAKHKTGLYRYLLRKVRHVALATDLFQDVWLRVIATRGRYAPRAKFATFLFHIGHNCAIDHFRRQRSSRIEANTEMQIQESAAPWYERPEAVAEYDEQRAAFAAALERLPEEQREAFVLHEESGLDVAEIAQITGVGVETAKSRLRYAIGKLRRALAHSQPQAARAY